MSSPSTASTVRRVLVIGYGAVGTAVIQGLTAPQYKDRIAAFVLVRADIINATTESYKTKRLNNIKPTGVQVLVGDISDDQQTLTNTLKNAAIDVVISTVDNHNINQQIPLIAAAKAAGVTHFFPSEFGFDYNVIGRNTGIGMVNEKLNIQDVLKKSGLKYTFVVTAAFAEYATTMFMGVNIADGVVTAAGSFDSKLTVNALVDIGALTAAAVLSPSAVNQTIFLAGETLTFSKIADDLETVIGRPVKRIVQSVDELQAAVSGGNDNARYALLVANQRGVYVEKSQSWNAINVPNYRTVTFIEALRQKINTRPEDDVVTYFVAN